MRCWSPQSDAMRGDTNRNIIVSMLTAPSALEVVGWRDTKFRHHGSGFTVAEPGRRHIRLKEIMLNKLLSDESTYKGPTQLTNPYNIYKT